MALTPRWEFRKPILQALAMFGGRKKLEYLYPVIEEFMAGTLTEEDEELYSDNGRSPEPKWHTAVRAEREIMKKEGLLMPPDSAHHGVWQWTEFGRKSHEKDCQ